MELTSTTKLILLLSSISVIIMTKVYLPTFTRVYRHFFRGNVAKNKGALRIGTLGAARITPMALTNPASYDPDADVIAVAARNINTAKKFADKHKIKTVHTNYEQLIEDPNVEAIYNPLPNGLHYEWTIKALKAGKHVLCEKPLGSNQKEAEEMSRIAKENGLILAEAFHYRYHPATRRLVEIIKSGEIGDIKDVLVYLHIPAIVFNKDDIRFNFDLAGGTLMDLGCYAVNFVRLVMDREPLRVTKAKATLVKPQVDERIEAEFEFDRDATARIDVSLRAWDLSQKATITGTKGTIVITGIPTVGIVHAIKVTSPQGKRTEKHYGNGDSTYACQLKDFVKLVRGQNPTITTPAEDGVLNMKVIDEIYTKAGLAIRGN